MEPNIPELPYIAEGNQIEALQVLLSLAASYIVIIDPQFQGRPPQEVVKWLASHLDDLEQRKKNEENTP